MAKTYCTCTCIKSSKEYACCVWKHSKCAQVSYIMMIWDMGTSNTLTHNHNCLMGTITFEVYHITFTSPRNMLTIILKAFWFFFLLSFFCVHIFLFEHIMHGHIRERKEIPNYVKPKTSQFCYVKAHRWDDYLCLSFRIF